MISAGTDLTSLLCMDKALEPVPEPYRMQKGCVIKVDFDTFKDYVLHAQLPDAVSLAIDMAAMKQCLFTSNLTIYNYYYKCLAKAQLKELSIAEFYNSYASLIIPSVQSDDTCSLDSMKSVEDVVLTFADAVLDEMRSYGYKLNITKESKNYDIYILALYYNFTATLGADLHPYNVIT